GHERAVELLGPQLVVGPVDGGDRAHRDSASSSMSTRRRPSPAGFAHQMPKAGTRAHTAATPSSTVWGPKTSAFTTSCAPAATAGAPPSRPASRSSVVNAHAAIG